MAARVDGGSFKDDDNLLTDRYMPLAVLSEVTYTAETGRYREEIKDKQKTLKLLQNDIEKEKRLHSELQLEICTLNKRVCVSQDETASIKRMTSKYLQSIESFIIDNKTLEMTLNEKDKVGKYYSDLLSQYSEKTKAYKSKVSESEDKLLIVVQLKDAQEKLKEMKDKRASYVSENSLKILSGERQKEIESKIDDHTTQEQQIIQDTAALKQKSLTIKDNIKKLLAELEISRKRKQAHLLRLRHQLHEAQSRKRQWAVEVERLKTTVKSLKRKIEE